MIFFSNVDIFKVHAQRLLVVNLIFFKLFTTTFKQTINEHDVWKFIIIYNEFDPKLDRYR